MKNFGTKRQRASAFGAGNELLALASSTDQLSVVWSSTAGVVAASPQAGGGASRINVDVARYPSDFDIASAINMRREGQIGLPRLSDNTLFSTVAPDFSERTRILALDGEKLSLSDEELAEWLIHAEQQMFLGTDNHPLFETSLEETACAIGRLPNGQVAITEVPRQHVHALQERVRRLSGAQSVADLDLIVETPVRSTARYFLTLTNEGEAVRRPGKESEVTAFLLINRSGFSFGLWSPSTGLFNEYSFLAPKDLDTSSSKGDVLEDARSGKKGAVKADLALTAYIRHAFDQLFIQLSPDKLEQMRLANYAQIVWACEVGLSETAAPIAKEYSQKSGLETIQMPAPVDEAAATGLLLGSHDFGDVSPAGARILPPVNLARDLMVLATREEVERRRIEDVEAAKRRNRAVFTLLAAPVVMAAILLAIFADLVRETAMTAYRDARADQRTAELKPALDRRRSYEANLQWYQEFVTQVSSLRGQQPVGIGLLYQLDNNYPFTLDPSFFVSDLKMDQKGDIEMKGMARNKDAIASFLKTLEFAGGDASGSRLFSNLAYEVQESMPAQAGTPAIAGSTLGATSAAPGVVTWSMRGNYLPMAATVPPDPNAKPPVVPPGAPPPAAAPAAVN
jgi:hypothetical protein